MTKNSISYTVFSGILFSLLFIYVLLRSLWVEPIHDELATLFHYIDYNAIWGDNIVLDANNHLLNSFLGKVCYSVFGDHIWAIRLPNVLSFIVFFLGVFKLSKFIKTEYLKYVFIIAFTCIPYVLDYFAYSRGYGMSMAFLMMGIYYFFSLNEHYNTKKLLLLSFFLILAIYANLNLIILLVLMLAYLGIKVLIQSRQEKSYRLFYQFIATSIGVTLILLPAIQFTFRLRDHGALYYGTQDGLWLTTGATLSQYVLDSESIFIKYVLIATIVLLTFHFIFSLVKKGIALTFQNPATLFIGLFLGSLIAVELMRWILDTNYPEDRVGMHLIFLCIGAVIFTLQNYSKVAWLSFVFLLLPIVAMKHFNFVTSAFSPDDRIEKADYDFFLEQAKPNKSTSLYFTQMLAYAYHVRKSNPTDFIVPSSFTSITNYNEEIVSSKTTEVNLPKAKGYTLLRHNPNTWATYLERNVKYDWKEIKQSVERNIETSDMYYSLSDPMWEENPGKHLKYVIDCEIYTPELGRETVVLVIDKTDKNGDNSYVAFNLNWAAGKVKNYKFKRVFEFFTDETEELKIYLYNPNHFNYKLIEKKITVFEAN